jgi:mRNA interferase RelE/StbE
VAYTVRLRPAARGQLKGLDREARRRVAVRIDELAEQPRPPDARPLSGVPGVLRIRVGDFRVLYEVADDVLEVLVIRLGHRRDVYRRLGR